jgi:stage II sporulation protein D
MKFPWCVLAIAAGVGAACSAGVRPNPISVPSMKAPSLRVKTARGPVVRVALEDYVRGAMLSEFAPAAGDPAQVTRMLEVQAVIARTYAIAHRTRHATEGFDLCSTTHCQLYHPEHLEASMWKSQVEDAARRTEGMILLYDGAAARALFHADCGGHTSAASEVWAGPARPYLSARKDDGPAEAAHAGWRFEPATAALLDALNASATTRVGKTLRTIRVSGRDSGGRATQVRIEGTRTTIVRGEELRTVLTRRFGPKSIRSTRFDVVQERDRIVFIGRGYGHGVGLCQAGAYARVKAGARPEQVLARYYPGTRLVVFR